MNTRYSILFESFKIYFPTIASQAVDGYVSGPQEITVYLSDGDKLIYDDCTQTIRYLNKTINNPEEDVWRREFGRRLNEKIYRSGMTQQEVAQQTGISQQIISRYVSGKATPSAYNMRRLAVALNCSITELTYFD